MAGAKENSAEAEKENRTHRERRSQKVSKQKRMKQIRQGVFETNSSSTHSICIAKDVDPELPKRIAFRFGEFGWECDTLRSEHEKASYLYTGLFHVGRVEGFKKISETLKSKGIEVTAEEPIYKDDSKWAENSGYVDHGDELGPFLDDVCSDEGKLLRFLFSDLSFIITGNDNDEEDVDINVSYPYDKYYKGN